jgi:hypothetical protein
MKNFLFLFLLIPVMALWLSCKTKPSVAGDSFGAGVSNPGSSMAFADVVKQLDTQDTVKAVMKAKVSEVCQDRGCWMNLVDPEAASNESLFVKFKNYGFFVPKDIAGRQVLVEGVAFKQETTVKELRHYAEDAGKSEAEIAKITEPVTEKKFMATGVVVLD